MNNFEQLERFLEALNSNEPLRQDVVGNDVVGEYTIDTCYTLDCGYETGIVKGSGHWIIVQRYETRELAEKGHAVWMAMCAAEPKGAYSVQFDIYERF